jgi:hypothetical protein
MASKARIAILALDTLIVISLVTAPALLKAQAYSVSFTVVGIPGEARTQYYLDGILNGTIASGDTKTLSISPGGAHTLSVDLNVGGANGTRYQCKDNLWSFAGTATGTHPFTYKAQYYLEVVSQYGTPSRSDWYDGGTTAQAKLDTNMTSGSEGVRYLFVKWGQDASGQGTISDLIIMNGPKKAVATWKTQYILRISYDPVGLFSPSTLWFDAGSTADFLAPKGTNGTDTRQIFVQWEGDYTGTDSHGSTRMDGPKSVTARYKTQYKLEVTYDPPDIAQKISAPNSTWYDAGETASLGPVPQIISIQGSSVERFVWLSWNIDGMTQPGTSAELAMNKPHNVRLIYQTQYYLLVTSSFGETTGTGWYVDGEKARFDVTYSGSELLVKHTLAGWRLNSSNAISALPPGENEVTMDRPYVVEAQWTTDYAPLWIFIVSLGAAATIVTAVIFIIVKRPRSLARLGSSLSSGVKRHRTAVAGTARKRDQAPATAGSEELDSRVYQYIAKRNGEISLSQASKDLGLSVSEVELSTERLKRKGLLA